uniref:Uncharacterized protein n=1 Tax=Rhizophora mucronata TaxID=61149 RepID=A0A2P2Q1E6_RHIMU
MLLPRRRRLLLLLLLLLDLPSLHTNVVSLRANYAPTGRK